MTHRDGKRVSRLEIPNPFVFSDTSSKAKREDIAEGDLHVKDWASIRTDNGNN
jgi:hypothetical protein